MRRGARSAIIVLGALGSLSLQASACRRGHQSDRNAPASQQERASAGSGGEQRGATLAQSLKVKSAAPKPGEPVSLVGGKYILCAHRHEAPIACQGELSLRLRAPSKDDARLYPDGHTAEAPLGLEGRDLSRLDAHGRKRCFIEDGSTYCWRGAANDRNITKLPLDKSNAREVRVMSRGQQAIVTEDGDYVQFQVQPCKGRPDYGGGPRTPKGLDKVRTILGGGRFECVVNIDDTVSCWGNVGGPESCTEDAVTIEGLTDIVDGAVGLFSACVLRADNRVLCFGENRGYGLGVTPEKLESSDAPVEVAGVYPAVKIDGIDEDYVALGANGEVWAWGRHIDEKKDGHARRFDMPRPAIDVAVLDGMFCALLDDHSLRCEGDLVRHGLENGSGRPLFESKDLWVNAVPHQIVELIDDPDGGAERDKERKKQGLPPWDWN